MSVKYEPVQWNRAKWVYDLALILGSAGYLYVYLRLGNGVAGFENGAPNIQITRMRAFGSCAFLMLSVILLIGPLARLDRRFLPLLYNRRHFGVLTCAVAVAHAGFVLDWYFAFSDTPVFEGVLISNTTYGAFIGFPFEALGIAALLVLLILAVTSHDFWLSFLTPPVWKAIHMLIYPAYAAVVGHVALGYLQDAKSTTTLLLFVVPALAVAAAHIAAARRTAQEEAAFEGAAAAEGWVRVGRFEEIARDRAKIVTLPDGGERVAIYRYGDAGEKFSAISNVCAHQNGPLGEGRIIDGCVTCPWHGFQFRPEDGCAPAPFTDKIPTYRLKRDGAELFVHREALAPGTPVEPIRIEEAPA